ncbi:glutathione S-transferase N-terminal domain-containing protein [Vreelandella olivaria]|uniref:glutathione S-transferase N-terminal domain-containing protein n=1 Tax=Vreelandella olivaria TaxID=390919 RepID=UPI00201F1071|nr:glutathione S-transferase N-terminal domain-containing protein [Halomonas olivaria]
MELFLNATSPYARMVRIIVMERGLADTVTLRWCDPWADDADLIRANPAGRIPALITAKGTTLSESLLIALYLDSFGQAEPMLPHDQLEQVLHFTGLGQSLMDAAFTTVISRKHQDSEADGGVLGQRRWRGIRRTLDQLEGELPTPQPTSNVTLGDIAVAVALDYLSFRLPELTWGNSRPQLKAWHHTVCSRDSFRQTAFA